MESSGKAARSLLVAIRSVVALLLLTLCIGCSDSESRDPAAPSPSPTVTAGSTRTFVIENTRISVALPTAWSFGAPSMPYATCLPCTVAGPLDATHPYGIQFWRGEHQVGCQLSCYITIRAGPLSQNVSHTINVNGRLALQQEFERQRPLGLVNEDGDNTSYREILTVVPLATVDGLPPETFVPAIFIEAFFRYCDAAAERDARAALNAVLQALVIERASARSIR